MHTHISLLMRIDRTREDEVHCYARFGNLLREIIYHSLVCSYNRGPSGLVKSSGNVKHLSATKNPPCGS